VPTSAIRVTITRWVQDTQPGVVAFQLVDAHGVAHEFIEKTSVVDSEPLDPAVAHPQPGAIECTLVAHTIDSGGAPLITVSTEKPWHIESTAGQTLFVVRPEQLVGPARPLAIYVDVDDTLVRSVGSKRIPIPHVVQHVRDLFAAGAELYLWSRGGAAYARDTAQELGIADCFRAFLPKPTAILDDEALPSWTFVRSVHPASCHGLKPGDYRD